MKRYSLFLLALGSAGLLFIVLNPFKRDSSSGTALSGTIENENRQLLKSKLDQMYGYNL